MLYIKGTKINFQYETATEMLLKAIDFEINSESKIGLIGDNGSGKTTLFQLILDQLSGVTGTFYRKKGLQIGYLKQLFTLDEQLTVAQFLFAGDETLWRIKGRLEESDQLDDDEMISLLERYETLGGYDFEVKIEEMITRWGFSKTFLKQPFHRLSGGEQTALGLKRLMLTRPDLLLLDEPTNHLDYDTLGWLEGYLSEIEIPFIVISHDRGFLDQTVNTIWHLDQKHLTHYSGNYSDFRRLLTEHQNHQQHQYEIQQQTIKRLKKSLDERKSWAVRHQGESGANGKAPVYESVTNKAKSAMKRMKNVEKRIELMIEREAAKRPFIKKRRGITFDDDGVIKSGYLLTVEQLSKSFDSPVLKNCSLTLQAGERLGITGKNGSGKSTLLKILMGLIEADCGTFRFSPRVKIGYYAQGYENLNLEKTVLEEVLQGRYQEQTEARTILGCLNLSGDQVYQTINTLSIGERSKVALGKIIFSNCNLLILDEPTNHLEISAREGLEEALRGFRGGIIVVSHDRYFMERVVDRMIDLQLIEQAF